MKKAVCLFLSVLFVCSFVLTACLYTRHTCCACDCMVCEMCREQEKCAEDVRNADMKRSRLYNRTEIKFASALLPADTPAERKDKLTN